MNRIFRLYELREAWAGFTASSSGNVALMVAVVFPLIGGATLYTVDYTELSTKTAGLQDAADAAALSAAREMAFLYLGNDNERHSNDTLTAIAAGIAQNTLDNPGAALSVNAVQLEEQQVRVDLSLDIDTTFGELTGLGDQTMSVSATAEIFNAQNICILLLQGNTVSSAAKLEDTAQIKADQCGLHSNGPSPQSIIAMASAYIDVDYICTVGGYVGGDNNVKSPVVTDCPTIEDPLIMRQMAGIEASDCQNNLPSDGIMISGSTAGTYEINAPMVGQQFEDENANPIEAQILSSGTHTLGPGTYCGGLVIEGDADVWMEPGQYFFNGGPLIVRGDAKLSGEYVGLFHDDSLSYFAFLDNAEIELSAPKTGQMAGILFTTGPKCTFDRCLIVRPFTIESPGVRSLLGTIYLPDDPLTIDTTMPVSEEAAFTIIVADRLFLKQSPTLVLNTDYAATDVPRPGELEDVNPKIRLLE